MNDTAATQRSSLLSMKLVALVRDHTGRAEVRAADGFGGGAAVLLDGVAWVLLDAQPERGLGAALAWALRRDATALHVLADRATGLLARRAVGFTFPVSVWHVEGRSLLPALTETLSSREPLAPAHREWWSTIVDAGALPVVEHGVLAGEVEGLEVCRVVDDPDTGAVRLEVGVGAHDRESFLLLHGDRPTAESLADVVRAVAAHRQPGAARHPLNLLAQERALRARLVADPTLIGASEVYPAEPPTPRQNLKDAVPCVATAVIDGVSTVVVCSSGVDIDVVPFAVDARAVLGVTECRVVVPSRDALDVQRRLGALAQPPITIVAITNGPITNGPITNSTANP